MICLVSVVSGYLVIKRLSPSIGARTVKILNAALLDPFTFFYLVHSYKYCSWFLSLSADHVSCDCKYFDFISSSCRRSTHAYRTYSEHLPSDYILNRPVVSFFVKVSFWSDKVKIKAGSFFPVVLATSLSLPSRMS